MKKTFLTLMVGLILFSSIPAFGQWIGEIDYFNYTIESRPEFFEESAGKYGFYLGYDLGNWEVAVSYYKWSKTYDFSIFSTDYSWTLNITPIHLNAIYKFSVPKAEGWQPFVGLGYGQTQVKWSGDGIDDEGDTWESWGYMIGVRYFFSEQLAVTLKYSGIEIDVDDGLLLGTGYGLGVLYKF